MGRALSLKFAQSGLDVVASARSVDALAELADQNARISALPVDVEKPGDVQSIVSHMDAVEELPDLTIVCSAIYEPGGIDVLTHTAAQKHMAVNYLGAVGVLEALYPVLKARGKGDIAIVASLTAYCGLPLASLYGPTKAALASLCETLQPEFDKAGLGLMLVNPGFVKTPLTEKNSFSMPFIMTADEAADRIIDGLDRGRFEIAFPKRLAWLLRGLSLLPYSLYFSLTRRMVK